MPVVLCSQTNHCATSSIATASTPEHANAARPRCEPLFELRLLLDQERRLLNPPFLLESENEAALVPVLDHVAHVRGELRIVLAHADAPRLGIDRRQHHRIIGPLRVAGDAGEECRVEYGT